MNEDDIERHIILVLSIILEISRILNEHCIRAIRGLNTFLFLMKLERLHLVARTPIS